MLVASFNYLGNSIDPEQHHQIRSRTRSPCSFHEARIFRYLGLHWAVEVVNDSSREMAQQSGSASYLSLVAACDE